MVSDAANLDKQRQAEREQFACDQAKLREIERDMNAALDWLRSYYRDADNWDDGVDGAAEWARETIGEWMERQGRIPAPSMQEVLF